MSGHAFARAWGGVVAALAMLFVGGCSTLLPKPPAPPSFYALDAAATAAPAAGAAARPAAASTAPTLIVAAPQAAAGFDTRRIVYLRRAHQLEYFAHAEWVDTPARMLAPLLVDALEAGGAFRAVVAAPGAAIGELRLDTTILRLQQDFTVQPSRVRLTLRATLVDAASRRVLAVRELDVVSASASEDAYGGVAAANLAVHQLLETLALFCADAARDWRTPP